MNRSIRYNVSLNFKNRYIWGPRQYSVWFWLMWQMGPTWSREPQCQIYFFFLQPSISIFKKKPSISLHFLLFSPPFPIYDLQWLLPTRACCYKITSRSRPTWPWNEVIPCRLNCTQRRPLPSLCKRCRCSRHAAANSKRWCCNTETAAFEKHYCTTTDVLLPEESATTAHRATVDPALC